MTHLFSWVGDPAGWVLPSVSSLPTSVQALQPEEEEASNGILPNSVQEEVRRSETLGQPLPEGLPQHCISLFAHC